MIRLLLPALLVAVMEGAARAQAPGVPIEQPATSNGSKEVIAKAGALRQAGKLTGSGRIKELLDKPVSEKVTLPAAKSTPLNRVEIYELARRSRVQVGWYYLCH